MKRDWKTELDRRKKLPTTIKTLPNGEKEIAIYRLSQMKSISKRRLIRWCRDGLLMRKPLANGLVERKIVYLEHTNYGNEFRTSLEAWERFTALTRRQG